MELQADLRCENVHSVTVLTGMVAADFAIDAVSDSTPILSAEYKTLFIEPFLEFFKL